MTRTTRCSSPSAKTSRTADDRCCSDDMGDGDDDDGGDVVVVVVAAADVADGGCADGIGSP